LSAANTEELDFLIAGQGLAGTLLSHFLLLENQRVKVVDFPHPGATSKIAAGVINPVTGRRIAKSWRFEELLPFAKKTYRELESLLGIEIWRERNILRALHNNFEESEWDRRGAFPEYEPYFEEEADASSFSGKIRQPFAWGELRQSAQAALPELVNAYRLWLEKQDLFLNENFDYQQVKTSEDRAFYRHFSAKKIVFCEGAQALNNPFFNHLPFVVTKGELLIVRIPGAGFEKMVKHKVFIVPIAHDPGSVEKSEPDLYWVGSTSRWEFDGPEPTEERRKWLVKQLDEVLEIPYEIVGHHAGIRPTVQDIRPFLGVHPHYPALAIFNGLGTKGASLGPFFAKQMADFLVGKGNLEDEADILRFSNPAA
jgi:glycine oxidase